MTQDAKRAEEIATALMPAVNRYLLAVVEFDVTAPRIDHMDRELLASGNYTFDAKWSGRLKLGGNVVEPTDLHLMDRSQWEDFFARRRARVAEMGWKVEDPEHCPKALAEAEKRRQAIALVREAAAYFPPLDPQALIRQRDKFDRFVHLLVGMVVRLPGYEKPVIAGA